MKENVILPPRLNRWRVIGPVIAVIAALLFAATTLAPGLPHGPALFWQAYLYGWLVWTGFSLGCMGLMLLHYVVRGSWGKPVIRMFEAGARCLPLNLITFFPLLAGASYLYPWMHPGDDEILRHHANYMNLPGYGIRTVFFFMVWIGMTFLLTRYSRLQDKNNDPDLAQFRTNVSSIGMVIYCLTVNFAYTDWAMSLEPHWYSTIYGVWWVIADSIAAMSLVAALTAFNKDSAPWNTAVTNDTRRDFGNMMLMLIMVWTYFALSQFLIIWSANQPQEITFYLNRFSNGWLPIGWFIVLFQFFGPFLALLSGKTKRYATGVASVAMWLLFLRPIDTAWTILPAFPGLSPLTILLPCIFAFAAFGGAWAWWFIAQLKQAPLIPVYDTRAAKEVLGHA